MADKIYLVTEDYIKENSEIQDNTDIKLVKRNIIVAQDIYIQEILGTSLYRAILANIKAGSISAEYRTLLEDYIQPCTLNYALVKSMPFLNYKLTNKAVVKKEADNTITSDLKEIQFLQDTYRDTAEFYAERMIKFLLENYEADYPLYANSNNDDIDEMKHKTNSPYATGGLYLGDVDINRC